jgi:hypothetical protein
MLEAAKLFIFSNSPRLSPGPIKLPLGDGIRYWGKAVGAWSWPQLYICSSYMPWRLVQEQLCLCFIIITIHNQLRLDRCVSASSNSLFKNLPRLLRPFGLKFSPIFVILLLFIFVTCRSQFDLHTDVNVYLWDFWFLRWIVNLRGGQCVRHSVHEWKVFVSSPLVCSGALRCVVPVPAALERYASFVGVKMPYRRPTAVAAQDYSQRRQDDRRSSSVEWVGEWVRPVLYDWLQQLVTWSGDVFWGVVCALWVKQQGMCCCWYACGNTVLLAYF